MLAGFLLGVLSVFIMFSVIGFGIYLGKEIAVDHTAKKGFFTAYGKKYKAVECN